MTDHTTESLLQRIEILEAQNRRAWRMALYAGALGLLGAAGALASCKGAAPSEIVLVNDAGQRAELKADGLIFYQGDVPRLALRGGGMIEASSGEKRRVTLNASQLLMTDDKGRQRMTLEDESLLFSSGESGKPAVAIQTGPTGATILLHSPAGKASALLRAGADEAELVLRDGSGKSRTISQSGKGDQQEDKARESPPKPASRPPARPATPKELGF